MTAPLGTFSDPDALMSLLAARKAELGLSNEALEQVAGFASGIADKYLGPSRTKTPTLSTLAILMDALGVSAVLVVDDAKAARMAAGWARQGRRQEGKVHPPDRVNKKMLARLRPHLLRELGRKGAKARWARSTPETRAAAIAKLNAARLAKRRAGMSK